MPSQPPVRPLPAALRLLHALAINPVGRIALSSLAGTLLFLSCADFDIWPLCWVGMVPLLAVLLDGDGSPRGGHAFLWGWLCGLLANGGGFYWIVGLLQRFGHMPLVAALPIFVLLIAYQAITFGFFAWSLCRLRTHLNIPVTWLAPLCWTACELCVPYVFPWYLAITQAWVPPVIQIADITGPLGVSFLLVLANGALFDLGCALWRARGWPERRALRAPGLAVLVILACLGYGLVRIQQVQGARAAAPKIRVGVVQANIGIHEKFVPGLREEQAAVHQRLSAALEQRGAELIVWPESSYPFPLRRPVVADFPEDDPRRVRRGFSTPLLFGALTYDVSGPRPVPYNTALMMDRDGRITGTFDKNFLLIFGEYIPYAEHMGWLRELVPEMSNFARGTTTTTFPLLHQGQTYRIGPMICYEDIIPAFARRLFDTQTPPNLLINITNDAWFGATSEPWEHLALSVFRAVEHRVDLVRAVNTGVSAFIDATGRVYQAGPSVDPVVTPGVAPTTLLEEAALLPPGGLYQRLGESFGGGCLAVVLLLGAVARWRGDRPVRWRWLLGGLVALHLSLLLLAVLIPGIDVKVLYAVLAHRGEEALAEEAVFRATWQLGLLLITLSAALGAVVCSRAAGEPAEPHHVPGRLETLLAVLGVTIAPVLLVGRMEGNTGEVMLLTLLCLAASQIAGLLARRVARVRSRQTGAPR
ncbi:MAG: apolipoprotein N-acyltransferase [Myxococcales bacterium]|nr:apolipoprotein N-acyltransferase [Myxococcales bacterium]